MIALSALRTFIAAIWPFIVCLVTGIIFGWYFTQNYYVLKIQKIEGESLKRELEERAAYEDKLVESIKKSEALSRKINDLETESLQKIKAYQHETDDLRTKLANNAISLRVKAECDSAMSRAGTAADTGQPERVYPRLTQDAGQAYFSLRDGIAEISEKLSLCVKTLEDERK